MKKKEKDREEIWNSSIGILRKIPKHKVKWEFSWRDIIRPLAVFLICFIALFFYFEHWGLLIAIILTIIYEISGFKQHGGVLEVIGTDEFLPLIKMQLCNYLEKTSLLPKLLNKIFNFR